MASEKATRVSHMAILDQGSVLEPARMLLSKKIEKHNPFSSAKLRGEVRRYQRSG
jgi:hypothetical protein